MLSRQHNPFAGALVVLLYYYCYLQMYFTYINNIVQLSEHGKKWFQSELSCISMASVGKDLE